MKNLCKINIVFLFVLCITMIQVNAQTNGTNPQDEVPVDCKTTVVEPEIELTPGDTDEDPGDDPDNDDDGQEDLDENATRRVMFVHGYKGNEGSWSRANNFLANKSPGNNYISINGTYDTGGHPTLDQVATQIVSEYLADAQSWTTEEKKKNFFIAHSMGGMALRFLQNKFSPEDRPYGGIITVGSGHKGVFAANVVTWDTKKFHDFVGNLCTSIASPFIIDAIPPLTYNLLAMSGLFSEKTIIDKTCNGLVLPSIEFILGEEIDEDLTPVASNSYPAELEVKHKLALYGVEEDEGTFTVNYTKNEPPFKSKVYTINVEGLLFPKFFGSMMNSPGTYPQWGAGASDDAGLSTFSEGIYEFTKNKEVANHLFSKYINRPFSTHKARKQFDLLLANDKALKWMRDANFQYQVLIGGIQNVVVFQNKCSCELVHEDYGYERYITYNYTGDCAELIGTIIDGWTVNDSHPLYTVTASKFESDGFVLSNSASAMPNPSREPIQLKGSGHFQMRNDKNLGREFDNMFKENTYGPFWNLYK